VSIATVLILTDVYTGQHHAAPPSTDLLVPTGFLLLVFMSHIN